MLTQPCLQLTCIYLFHELPPEARKQAAREMARVVKPGGVVVITDSVQLGDRPDTDKGRHLFGGFNEPFYESFIVADLGRDLAAQSAQGCVQGRCNAAVNTCDATCRSERSAQGVHSHKPLHESMRPSLRPLWPTWVRAQAARGVSCWTGAVQG